MRYWWVNQNQTYKTEVPGGFLWSPKTKADGGKNPFYENMLRIEPNDVVFSFCDTYIKAAGLATEGATSTPKPDFGSASKSWSEEGWLVPVEFREFGKPLRPKAHIEELKPYLPKKYSPLKPTGDGLRAVYLTELPQSLAEQLIRLLGKQYESIVEELSTDVSIDNSEDSQERLIKGRTDIGPTAKEQATRQSTPRARNLSGQRKTQRKRVPRHQGCKSYLPASESYQTVEGLLGRGKAKRL